VVILDRKGNNGGNRAPYLRKWLERGIIFTFTAGKISLTANLRYTILKAGSSMEIPCDHKKI
jgi:hypothetical protein